MKMFFAIFVFLSPLAFGLSFGGLEVSEYEMGVSPSLVFSVREPISAGTTIKIYSNSQIIATAVFTADVALGESVAIANGFFSHGEIRSVPQIISIAANGREICRTEDFKLRRKADLSGREAK